MIESPRGQVRRSDWPTTGARSPGAGITRSQVADALMHLDAAGPGSPTTARHTGPRRGHATSGQVCAESGFSVRRIGPDESAAYPREDPTLHQR